MKATERGTVPDYHKTENLQSENKSQAKLDSDWYGERNKFMRSAVGDAAVEARTCWRSEAMGADPVGATRVGLDRQTTEQSRRSAARCAVMHRLFD
jgi:hypothetical protein